MKGKLKGKLKGKIYVCGVIGTLLSLSGIAEHITSGRGSFMICAIIFGISFGAVLVGYTK